MQPDGMLFRSNDLDPSQLGILKASRLNPKRELDPYVSGKTGELLITTLEEAGLTIANQAVIDMGIFQNEPVYGNLTMQYGRFLGRLINYPWQSVQVFDQPESLSQTNGNFRITGNEVVDHYNDILSQIIHRDLASEYAQSNVEMTEREMSVNYGSCSEAEPNYIASYASDDLELVQNGDAMFWRKTLGEKTLINISPVMYRGIELPPGWLFGRDNKDVHAIYPLRPTSFMFNTKVANEAFQGSLSKVDSGSYEDLRQLFLDLTRQYR